MGHHHLHVRVAGQHVPGNHVGDGTGRFGKVFLHGKRGLLHYVLVDGLRPVKVQNHDGVLFIQVVKQGIQFGCAQVLTLYVGCKLDAVGLERIEGVSRFGDSRRRNRAAGQRASK